MLKKILVPALGAFSLGAASVAALAQQEPVYAPPPPPQQYQQYQAAPQPQANPACVRLESQLASLDAQGGADPQRQQIEAAYNQQRQQMDAMIQRSRGMGCGRNFLFGPRPPAECRGLEAQIDRVRDQVERLESQLRRGGGDAGLREARRRDLIAALAQYQCGPQYQAAAPQQPRGAGGLFGLLFGNRGGGFQQPPAQEYQQVPQTSTYRTVCVRTCDGFFFPVSFSTVQSRFPQDENMCRRTCPGTEAIMFAYPNPGGSMEQATSTSGQPYTSLPNAFKYQTEFVKDCSCKPAGMSWEQALAGADDDTVQRGDIIVDDERSRAMSQPGETIVTPDQAARAAQDSAIDVTNDGVTEAPANTDPPPGLENYATQPGVAQPSERTAVPYYVPPPQREQPVHPNFR